MSGLLCIIILLHPFYLTRARDARGDDISGYGMVATVGAKLPSPMIIEVTDNKGVPQKDVPVSLRIISAPSGVDKGYLNTIFTATTDSRGYAIFSLGAGDMEGEYWLSATSPLSEESVRLSYIAMRSGFLFFLIIGLLGGFALFMYGLNFGGKALTRIAGGKLRELLWRMTKNPVVGVAVGIFITILTQSSSATTVMLVSFAEAGLVNFVQTLGVILGAGIGTTLTVQLIAFKVFDIALLVIASGFFMMIFGKGKRIHYAGRVLFSFGLIFFGMKLMTDAVHPLTFLPGVTDKLISIGEYHILLLVLSSLFTAVIQASGATMAIVLALSFEGLINLQTAIAIILGANIGTSITALLASLGRSVEAKRVAMAHIIFRVIMAAIFLPFIPQFATLVGYIPGSAPRQVANAHTLFNLFSALLFLPLLLPYARLIKRLVPRKKTEFQPRYLDHTLLSSPTIAIAQALRETLRMADIVHSMLVRSIEVLRTDEETERTKVIKDDDKVDALEENITLYLIKMSQEEVSLELSKRSAKLLHIVAQFEHIGDVVSKSLMVYAGKKIKKGFLFSEKGFREIEEFTEFSKETLGMAINALATSDSALAMEVVKRGKQGRNLLSRYHDRHLDRLRKGIPESIETSTVHLDLISDLERINFHASNIGEHIQNF